MWAIAAEQKAAVIDMRQDMTHYFDLHHTPDDTLDKVDPADLQQNVDTWAAVLKIAGMHDAPGRGCGPALIGGAVGQRAPRRINRRGSQVSGSGASLIVGVSSMAS
jgi:hypothetical protein